MFHGIPGHFLAVHIEHARPALAQARTIDLVIESAFDITGNVINSPAARALDTFTVTIENNIVKVETGKRIKRNGFEPKQVVYQKKD
jgi:hypothetical protein